MMYRAGKQDWREVAFANIGDTPARKAYSVVEETPAELVTAEAATEDLPSAYAAEATWSVAVEKTEEPEVQRATEPRIEAPVPSPAAIAMPDLISVQEAAPELETLPEPAPATVAAANNSWMSVPPSPWDAEVAKASKLAATWDTSAAVATIASVALPSVHQTALSSAPEPVAKVENDEIPTYVPAATEEIIREEAAQVVEESAPEVSHLPSVTEAAVIAAPSVDDMVARVLAKMDIGFASDDTRIAEASHRIHRSRRTQQEVSHSNHSILFRSARRVDALSFSPYSRRLLFASLHRLLAPMGRGAIPGMAREIAKAYESAVD